jgi:hypothetical protein
MTNTTKSSKLSAVALALVISLVAIAAIVGISYSITVPDNGVGVLVAMGIGVLVGAAIFGLIHLAVRKLF